MIDINQGFLDIALKSKINSKEINCYCENILKVKLKKESDLVLSIFAYHHVPDIDKRSYIAQIKSALKPGGILILTEIYFNNKDSCIAYYKNLFDSIPANQVVPGLREFLDQTAKSEDFEYKVSKKFSEKQFNEAGFKKISEKKIWPKNNSDQGTFVQVYSLI